MQLTLINFGQFEAKIIELSPLTVPNGYGKTTICNAYRFALNGSVLAGFEPRRAGATPQNVTEVQLSGFADLPIIRRVVTPKGTVLYVGDYVTTQTDFVRACSERGIDIDFAVACSDANILTNSALTSEDLRKLLVNVEVMDNGEANELRKSLKTLRERKKTAEQYALSNVTLPKRTIEPLEVSECTYIREYDEAAKKFVEGYAQTCKECGKPLSAAKVERDKQEYENAKRIVAEREKEAARIQKQADDYVKETQAIADAQRLIDAATKARADVLKIDEDIKNVEAKIRELDENAIRAELLDGVEIQTEATTKTTGVTKSVCTLTYNGVPLKSINRAKRVEICVRLLDAARTKKGMQHVPILLDNAESVNGLDDVENLIRFSVLPFNVFFDPAESESKRVGF